MISLKYALTKQDYKEFYVFVTWSSPDRKKKRLYYYGKQVLFSGLLVAALLYLDVFLFSRRIGWLVIGYVVLTLIFSFLTAQTRVSKAADSFLEDPLNESEFSENELFFSEEGITIKDDKTLTQMLWSAIVKKEETKDYYFLFRNSVDAVIIPKQVFRIQADKLSFEKLLLAKLSLDAEIAALSRS